MRLGSRSYLAAANCRASEGCDFSTSSGSSSKFLTPISSAFVARGALGSLYKIGFRHSNGERVGDSHDKSKAWRVSLPYQISVYSFSFT